MRPPRALEPAWRSMPSLCGPPLLELCTAPPAAEGPTPRTCASIREAAARAVQEVDAALAPIVAARKRPPRSVASPKGEAGRGGGGDARQGGGSASPKPRHAAPSRNFSRKFEEESERYSDDEDGHTAQSRVDFRLANADPQHRANEVPLSRSHRGETLVDMHALKRLFPSSTSLRDTGERRELTAEDVRRASDQRDRRLRRQHRQLQRQQQPPRLAASSSAPGLLRKERQQKALKEKRRETERLKALACAQALARAPEPAPAAQAPVAAERRTKPEAQGHPPRRGFSAPLQGRSAGLAGHGGGAAKATAVSANPLSGKQKVPAPGGLLQSPSRPMAARQQSRSPLQGTCSIRGGSSASSEALVAEDLDAELDSDYWQIALSYVRAIRVLRRWARKRRAPRLIVQFFRRHYMFFQVRAAYRLRSAAARRIQSQWRGFSGRVGRFVRFLIDTQWRELETCLLQQLFSSCPCDGETTVARPDLISGNTEALERQFSPAKRRSRSAGGFRPRAAAAGAAGDVPPGRRPRSAAKPIRQDIQDRKRMDEDISQMLQAQFRRRVLERTRANHLCVWVARRLLRSEVVERLYERCSYADEESSFPEPLRSSAPSVRKLVAVVGGVTEAPVLLSNCLPAAGRLGVEDVAEMVLCAHRRLGLHPTQEAAVVPFFRGLAGWRLDAVEGWVDSSRRTREGLLDRWSARWSLWRPVQSSSATVAERDHCGSGVPGEVVAAAGTGGVAVATGRPRRGTEGRPSSCGGRPSSRGSRPSSSGGILPPEPKSSVGAAGLSRSGSNVSSGGTAIAGQCSRPKGSTGWPLGGSGRRQPRASSLPKALHEALRHAQEANTGVWVG